MATKMSFPTVQQDYVQCKGGLNLVQPQVVNDPSYVVDAVNFEVSQYGGYRRIKGYERFDGRTSPTASSYSRGMATFTGAIAIGDTVTGQTSTKTAKVIFLEGNAIVVTKVSGTFTDGEVLLVGGNPVATLDSNWVAYGSAASYYDAYYKSLAADVYRADIQEVPGSGAVLGAWWYNDKLYAFRNSADGLSCGMYGSSVAGWVAVNLGHEVAFSVGGGDIDVGDTLTQGSVTATVRAVVIESGTLVATTAAGRLILSGVTGGHFIAGAATTNTAGTLTLGGAEAAITLAPGGRFEFDNYAFANTVKMYGCDGVNSEFEFDGTTFIQLNNGGSVKASFIVGHSHHLITLCGSSLIVSAIGDPYNYEVIKGASEISVGAVGTGLLKQPGSDTVSSLAVYTRDSSHILYGTSSSEFQLVTYQHGVGAFPYSAQNIGTAYSLDERGVIQIGASDQYGNFEHAALSRLYTPFLNEHGRYTSASSVYRSSNQYRIFFSDGYGIYITMAGKETMGALPVRFPHPVKCAFTTDTDDGERSFFGSTNGYVYEMEKGTSFDGQALQGTLTFPYWSVKSPRTLKTWRRGRLDADFTGYSAISIQPSIAYGSGQVIQPSSFTAGSSVMASAWDNGLWDTGTWDTDSSYPVDFELTGVGESMSLTVYSSSTFIEQFTIQGFLAHYINRRAMR